MLLNQGSSINVDNRNEEEFVRRQKLLILVIMLNDTLVQQLQAQKQWNLRRQQLSGMRSSSDQHGIAGADVDSCHLGTSWLCWSCCSSWSSLLGLCGSCILSSFLLYRWVLDKTFDLLL